MSSPATPLTPSDPRADLFVPDGAPLGEALARTTHLCVAAHADDAEWIGYHGIAACFGRDDAWFTACVVTDGAGSPRGGPYRDTSDGELVRLRAGEQRRAAVVGRYGALVQLAHPSARVRDPHDGRPLADLADLLAATRPSVVYVHAPTDRHETHAAVCARTLEALRRVDAATGGALPAPRVLGVEGWGDLDWLAPADRVELDVSDRPHLAAALMGVFDSQIAGGKRYDLAVLGRRTAHATFAEPRAADGASALALAVDLSAAARADGPPLEELVRGLLERFSGETLARLARVRGGAGAAGT